MDNNNEKNIWVFAYGSLIWNPGFEFNKVHIGYIKGYSRRFYQGSDQHRGSPESLGRVATLIEDENGTTWGLAFSISDNEKALEYLKQRESSIGGYTTILTKFYPKNHHHHYHNNKFIETLVYIALPCNRLFLGPSKNLSYEIAYAKGFCGYNIEYLSKLIAFMKIELPNIIDEHLIEIEMEVKNILIKNNDQHLLKYFNDAIDLWMNNNILNSIYFDDNYNIDEEEEDYMMMMADKLKQSIETKFSFNQQLIDEVNNMPKQQPIRCMIKY